MVENWNEKMKRGVIYTKYLSVRSSWNRTGVICCPVNVATCCIDNSKYYFNTLQGETCHRMTGNMLNFRDEAPHIICVWIKLLKPKWRQTFPLLKTCYKHLNLINHGFWIRCLNWRCKCFPFVNHLVFVVDRGKAST